jgi:hypothetical protein
LVVRQGSRPKRKKPRFVIIGKFFQSQRYVSLARNS